MASKLYKWTGSIKQPSSFDGDPPMWYGTDESGVSYAWLTTTYASACESENDDLAATTSSDAKTWVKQNSIQALTLNEECKREIRKTYSLEDELKANRTNDTTVLNAIGTIVTSYQTKKNALVGD
tara:strand:- start:751 stop:1125 length:375 start_codon:yes stop_codon:yes gene_type:complete